MGRNERKTDHPVSFAATPPQRGILTDIGGYAKFPSEEGWQRS